MSYFSVGFVLTADDDTPLGGVVDLEIVSVDGAPVLYVGSGTTGAITGLQLTAPDGPEVVTVVEADDLSGTVGLSDLVVIEHRTGDRLLALGRYDDAPGFYDIGEAGALDLRTDFDGPEGTLARGFAGAVAEFNKSAVILGSQFNDAGFDVWKIVGNGDTRYVREMEDVRERPLGDVGEIHVGTLKGRDIVFAASAQDDGIMAFDVDSRGALSTLATLRSNKLDGWNNVSDLETVEIGDRAFLLVGAAGSDTISVIRVSQGGNFKLIDREEDTLFTRFGGLQDLEVIEAENGRVFVVAAGADDGVTLMELTERGKLVQLETIIDGFDTTLRNVSSLETRLEGETAHVYVGSTPENGVTELLVDLSLSGDVIEGGAVAETLRGSKQDDVIWGNGMSDVLIGRAGDDRLIDGRGRDVLNGGSGDDVFEFIPDGRTDWVENFNPNRDQIDLTSFDRVYDISSIELFPTIRGAAVKVGDDIIRLLNRDNEPFDVSRFDEDMFIFG
ncbi:MAG: hypothetical protein AAFV62_06815 [Pseudomonadota bacterium]